jgi:hypothetical protein
MLPHSYFQSYLSCGYSRFRECWEEGSNGEVEYPSLEANETPDLSTILTLANCPRPVVIQTVLNRVSHQGCMPIWRWAEYSTGLKPSVQQALRARMWIVGWSDVSSPWVGAAVSGSRTVGRAARFQKILGFILFGILHLLCSSCQAWQGTGQTACGFLLDRYPRPFSWAVEYVSKTNGLPTFHPAVRFHCLLASL